MDHEALDRAGVGLADDRGDRRADQVRPAAGGQDHRHQGPGLRVAAHWFTRAAGCAGRARPRDPRGELPRGARRAHDHPGGQDEQGQQQDPVEPAAQHVGGPVHAEVETAVALVEGQRGDRGPGPDRGHPAPAELTPQEVGDQPEEHHGALGAAGGEGAVRESGRPDPVGDQVDTVRQVALQHRQHDERERRQPLVPPPGDREAHGRRRHGHPGGPRVTRLGRAVHHALPRVDPVPGHPVVDGLVDGRTAVQHELPEQGHDPEDHGGPDDDDPEEEQGLPRLPGTPGCRPHHRGPGGTPATAAGRAWARPARRGPGGPAAPPA